MAMSTGSANTGTLSEINVTPLVDVMLVLLIVFMVTAPMLQTGVDIDLPDAKAKTIESPEGKLIIKLTKDKKLFLGDMPVPADQVEPVLKGNARLQQEKEAYLHADHNLPYGEVIKVMAAIQGAGSGVRLSLVTDPLE